MVFFRVPHRNLYLLLLQWGTVLPTSGIRDVLSVIREQLHHEPSAGDIYIVMSKDRRIVRLFAYDNRSYSLFEKKFVAGYQFTRIIKDDEGREVAYRIAWRTLSSCWRIL